MDEKPKSLFLQLASFAFPRNKTCIYLPFAKRRGKVHRRAANFTSQDDEKTRIRFYELVWASCVRMWTEYVRVRPAEKERLPDALFFGAANSSFCRRSENVRMRSEWRLRLTMGMTNANKVD